MVSKVRLSGSKIEGIGVFALTDLSVGAVVLMVDDSHVVDARHPVPEGEEVYCDYLGNGRIVCMQVPERYINHSCEPNVSMRTRDGVREVVALRSIQAGEEIAYDYSINGLGDTTWTCACRASRCRKLIHSDFFHLPLDRQREYLPLLDEWFWKERAGEIELLQRMLRD